MRTLNKRNILSVTLATTVALLFSVAVPFIAEAQPIEFSEFRLRIEINSTDGDAGLHGIFDGEGWKSMTLKDTELKKLYRVRSFNEVELQGVTENFFESAEPPCDDQPLEAFLDRFEAGEYRLVGRTTDGKKMRSEAELTYDLPGAPENLAPTGSGVDGSGPVTLSWSPGSTLGNCPPGASPIADPGSVPLYGYEVVVTRESPEPALEHLVQVDPSETSLTVPAAFMQQNGIYKFEIVAIEARMDEDGDIEAGNQTITEAFFCTAGVNPCELPD